MSLDQWFSIQNPGLQGSRQNGLQNNNNDANDNTDKIILKNHLLCAYCIPETVLYTLHL